MRLVCAGVVFLGVVALTGSSYGTTIPLPMGIVIGRQAFRESCTDRWCQYERNFTDVTAAGRVTVRGKGMQVVLSVKRMHYRFYQYFCPYNCGPSNPRLNEPFGISGRTTEGSNFHAWCTSGQFGDAFGGDEPGAASPMVTAACKGGTQSVQGSFAFRFVLPPLDLGSPYGFISLGTPRFAAILVEA